MLHDAMKHARQRHDAIAVDLVNRLPQRRIGCLHRRQHLVADRRSGTVVVLRQQHDVIHDHHVGIGVVRSADAVCGDARHRIAARLHERRSIVADDILRTADVVRPIADKHLVVIVNLHPHVDVLRRVHARGKWRGDRQIIVLVTAVNALDLRFGEGARIKRRGVFIDDQLRSVSIPAAVEMIVPPAVDNLRAAEAHVVILVFPELRKDDRLIVIAGARGAVVLVIGNHAHIAFVDISRAVIASPNRIQRHGEKRDPVQIRPRRGEDAGGAGLNSCAGHADVDAPLPFHRHPPGNLRQDARARRRAAEAQPRNHQPLHRLILRHRVDWPGRWRGDGLGGSPAEARIVLQPLCLDRRERARHRAIRVKNQLTIDNRNPVR